MTGPYDLTWKFLFAAIVHQHRGEVSAARERAGAALALCQEHGFPFYLAGSMIVQGWARVEQGEEEEGVAQIREGLAAGSEFLRPYFLTLLAEAYRKMGKAEKGLLVVEEALARVQRSHGRQHEAELYRLKGELIVQKFKVQGSEFNGEEEAEECFRQALDIARRQQAKSWELRAATSLARLWQQQGKTTEARDLLAPVYNWFTEGFDTADLQEAKALLAELS